VKHVYTFVFTTDSLYRIPFRSGVGLDRFRCTSTFYHVPSNILLKSKGQTEKNQTV